jgi:hypothetical protein
MKEKEEPKTTGWLLSLSNQRDVRRIYLSLRHFRRMSFKDARFIIDGRYPNKAEETVTTIEGWWWLVSCCVSVYFLAHLRLWGRSPEKSDRCCGRRRSAGFLHWSSAVELHLW